MISGIRGEFIEKKENTVVVNVNGICYEILVPQIILKSIVKNCERNENIDLTTFHYFQSTPSKSIPILVGFTNEVEKEFFTKFISVSGVGPKVAVKALNKPISRIADAIANGDEKLLSSLPGIGKRKAREMIAKLQGKVGKFGLIQDKDVESEQEKISEDIKQEAKEVLLQLQYKKREAEKMIEKALEDNSRISSTESLLNQVYKHKSE